jgi:hypothetical protein
LGAGGGLGFGGSDYLGAGGFGFGGWCVGADVSGLGELAAVVDDELFDLCHGLLSAGGTSPVILLKD